MADPIDPPDSPLAGFGFDADDSWMRRAVSAEAPLEAGAIGSYELLETVGRGAQGIVYRARRRDTGEVVALKRLLGGAAVSPTGRARFAREFDTEAGLSHPNIVGVHRHEVVDGQPLLVMEWVDGVPVDRWAAGESGGGGPPPARQAGAERPDLRERLRVFLRVCKAVEHAHQRGVIHRDLKPSNILVDAAGEPRLLDFGLAKLVEPGDGPAPLTQSEGFVGTLAYAAPEQVRGGRGGVDTRTDVYALGTILYQLLTGRLPYEGAGDLAAIVEAIQRVEPARPSALVPGLDRDLDAVVARAMAKDKEGRYPSVDALAADVRRHLAGQPVEAGHRSVGSVLRGALRRHRVPAAIAGGYVVLTTGALAVALSLWREAVSERAEAESVVGFLHDAIDTGRPRSAVSGEYTVREMLDGFAARLGDGLPGRPEVEASLRDVLGTTYHGLGERDAAWAHLDRALALRRAALGPTHRDTLHTLLHWAKASQEQGRHAEAERAAREVVEASRRGPGRDSHNLHNGLYILTAALRARGSLEEAQGAAGELLEAVRRCHGEESEVFARAAGAMGGVLEARGRLDEAEVWLTRAWELWRRRAGEDHYETAMAAVGLAELRLRQGRPREAEALLRPAVTVCRAALEERNPRLIPVLSALGRALWSQGGFDEAAALYEEVLALARAAHGEDQPSVALALRNVASQRRGQRRFAEAEELFRQAVDMERRVHGPDHPALAESLQGLAATLWSQGSPAEAEPLLREALRINTLAYGERHQTVAINLFNLGAQAQDLGRPAEAGAHYQRALEIARAVLPAGHPDVAEILNNLGVLRLDLGDAPAAEQFFREGLTITAARLGGDHPGTAFFELQLADALRAGGRPDEALTLARRAVETLRAHAVRGPELLRGLESLGALLFDAGELDECLRVRGEALDAARGMLGDQDPRLADTLALLGQVRLALGHFAEAEPVLRECLAIRERALPQDWRRFNTMSSLGGALVGRGAALREPDPDRAAALFAEAEPLLLDGFEGMRDRPGAPAARVRAALDRLVGLYDAWGRPERAAEYRSLLAGPFAGP